MVVKVKGSNERNMDKDLSMLSNEMYRLKIETSVTSVVTNYNGEYSNRSLS